jgi:hypothetical protein
MFWLLDGGIMEVAQAHDYDYLVTIVYTGFLIASILILFLKRKDAKNVLSNIILPFSVILFLMALIGLPALSTRGGLDIEALERIYWILASLVSLLISSIAYLKTREKAEPSPFYPQSIES